MKAAEALRHWEIPMSDSLFSVPAGVPFDPAYPLWAVGAIAKPWDFNGWQRESLSWKIGCYIHGGLSGPGQVRYRGPGAERFLESVFVNNFSKFKVGVAKHAIACNEDGLVAGHGVLQRLADDEFRIFVHGLWGPFQHSRADFDVEQTIENNYLFQVAGPKCIDTLRAATGEDLGDVGFLRFKQVTVAGRECELMRIGMAGSLAYELHGPMEDAHEVYNAVLAAGEPHGIEQLGWKTYYVNHVEGGFPQQIWTFLPATAGVDGFSEFAATAPSYRVGSSRPLMCGSVEPDNLRARYRTPQEVGWGRSIVFDHDFIGRAALEREMAAPKRTIVTLEWNSDDVQAVFASYFSAGPEYKLFEFPVTPHHMGLIGHADHVTVGGRHVGIASGVIYSLFFKQILSHCTIDIDQAEIGNEVIVHWGDHGGPIKEIRAKVARYPYLTEGRNQAVKP
jgi:vanillate/3-O-methylgallate O-demethylase